jgi:TPP-dependent pyruvate/acetoin dehydrogenase alpha subunit
MSISEITTTTHRSTPENVFLGSESDALTLRLYRRMYFIRRFEETLLELFEEGVLAGTTHCCIGQEANCIGVIDHLRTGDHIFTNHRCHGHYLARTGDALGLLCEIMGKQSGVCGGLGGSQHICAHDVKSNGILGGTVPAAAGIALAMKMRGEPSISVAFVGDGTMGEGVIYETLNIASLWRIPFFLVCEDNEWSQSTPRRLNMAGDIVPRISSFGIPVTELDSTDVLEIHERAGEEIHRLRSEGGPRALVIRTYRLCHHSKSDDSRPVDEVDRRREIEPLRIHGPNLEITVREAIESEVELALSQVVERARILP